MIYWVRLWHNRRVENESNWRGEACGRHRPLATADGVNNPLVPGAGSPFLGGPAPCLLRSSDDCLGPGAKKTRAGAPQPPLLLRMTYTF